MRRWRFWAAKGRHISTAIILDSAARARHLPQLNVLCELCALFEALVQGQALQPVQTSTDFPGFGGDLFTSLGAIQAARVIGAKLSSFVVTDGAQIVTAKTQFMSMTTGTPLALLYAMHLTTERTACTSALAGRAGGSTVSASVADIGAELVD